MALKSNYENLLNTPFPTPTNSNTLVKVENVDKSNLIEEEYENDLQFVPAHRTGEALVELLEKENDDLSQQLEDILEHQKELARSNIKESRQLKTQVTFLQTSLDHATTKIQELEENRKKKTLTKDGSTKLTYKDDGSTTHMKNCDETLHQKRLDESDRCVEKLAEEYEQLKLENEHVSKSKADVEKKLAASLHDLHMLQQKFEEFQLNIEDHDQLKKAFEAQQMHIQELQVSLSNHRNIVSKLRERGVHITSSLASLSSGSIISESDDEFYSKKSQDDNINKNTLLTELENAWLKHQTSQPRTRQTSADTIKSSIFNPLQTIYNQLPSVDSALESIVLKAGIVERDALDDALSLIGRLENEYDHEKFLKEKRHIYYKEDYDTFSDKIQINDSEDVDYCQSSGDQLLEEVNAYSDVIVQKAASGIIEFAKSVIKSMIYMTWRWFRFTLIMTIAVLISLKDGPDSL